MNKLFIALLGLTALTMVAADCPNACSGHGDCQTNWDFCLCYNGYLGADCSQRLCQFGLSWIDTPQGDLNHDNVLTAGGGDNSLSGSARPAGTPDNSALNPMWRFQGWWERHPAALYGTNDQKFDLPFYVRPQEGHFYAECSNRGICNRDTGLCDCLTGYEGAACNRTTCQNDCSGHGVCQTITDVTPDHLHYRLWDADKTRICSCDGGYFGMDCSQRACMKNDDPLTITTTRENYNDGLTEANEIQIVEVRCPFNGDILDPSMSLVYTDVQFGDEYETSRFDPTDTQASNNAAVAAALKGLPNQVLADYTVDGVTLVEKVVAVTSAELEPENYYRWTIEFHEHLGDVPLLQANTFFKCRGGAEVNTLDPLTGAYTEENIDVSFSGDGPQFYMEIDGDIATAAGGSGGDLWSYTVYDKNGDVINDPIDPADTSAVSEYEFANSGAFTFFDAANTHTREVAKIGLDAGLDASNAARVHLNIKVHVDPVATVRNSQYTLKAQAAPRVIDSLGQGSTFQITVAGTDVPDYDQKHQLVITSNTATVLTCRYMLNDEFLAFVTVPNAAATDPFLASNILDGTTANFGVAFHTFNTQNFGVLETVHGSTLPGGIATDSEIGESFTWYSDKDAVFSHFVPLNHDGNAAIETLNVAFTNQIAPAYAIPLVIQIAQTSGAQDLYIWKVAGDTDWVVPLQGQNGGVGFDINDVVARTGEDETGQILDELDNYLVNQYPDDPMRQGLASVRIAFSGGMENDQRLCASQVSDARDAKYYIQIGSQGLNDSPECSDRGICDYGSGVCRCFKGYAGIDCSEQNALSMGFSSGGASAF